MSDLKEQIKDLLWNHYKVNGGFTQTAASFIDKMTTGKWLVGNELMDTLKSELEFREGQVKRLKERIAQLEKEKA